MTRPKNRLESNLLSDEKNQILRSEVKQSFPRFQGEVRFSMLLFLVRQTCVFQSFSDKVISILRGEFHAIKLLKKSMCQITVLKRKKKKKKKENLGLFPFEH